MEFSSLPTGRDFSVVVLGASGIAGRNVAAYLAQRCGAEGARWAVAGRDPHKIERTLGDIGVQAPATLTADVGDAASLAALASRTQVVLDLVGPYTLYGTPVIEACIANGAHYADLTGEIPFVRRTIDAFHERAAAAGVKIVQVSGFEAMPADLSVLLAAETARQRWQEELAEADVLVTTRQPRGRLGLSDFVSGGSLQSLAEMTAAEGAELIPDPAALVEDAALAAAVRQASPISLGPRSNAQGDAIGPMMPSPFINPAVIHRTMALTAAPPSPFRYREGMAIPGGGATLPLRYAAAGVLGATQTGLRALLTQARPSIRQRAAKGMRRALPASGSGPAGELLEEWTWQLSVEARTVGDRYLRVSLDADGHPGYLTTSRIFGEAGLLLAEGATPATFGCLTPAAALGTAHLDRFEQAGMRFSVSS
jgi:short subunit dehydrogenase-like uncharacterized protein